MVSIAEIMASATCPAGRCDGCVQRAHTALSALKEAGLVVVPREPSEAMVDQAQSWLDEERSSINHAWHAMIDAALSERSGQ